MSSIEIKRKLFDYIRDADNRKVKAIYTMVEKEIQEDSTIWTDEFVQELDNRVAEFENGSVKAHTWNEVKANSKKRTKKS
jgi:Putative addiction module component